MITNYLIIGIVLILVIVVAILTVIFSRRQRSKGLQNKYGPEYERIVQSTGDQKKAQAELEERQKRVEAMNIRPLSASEVEQYQVDWKALQAKFIEQPAQATVEADALIMDVMKMRGYPAADYESRAADLSVNYPSQVSNYRLAREIAVKNEQHMANTEELRQAFIYYRALFEELLKDETMLPERK